MQTNTEPIRINLPLAVYGGGDQTKNLKLKLFLIGKFKLAAPNDLLKLLKNRNNKLDLTIQEKNLLSKLWKDSELDDLDYTELFVCYLPEIIKNANDDFLKMLDPSPWYNKPRTGDHYHDYLRLYAVHSAKNVKRYTLPRVRAKLALKEIIVLLTSDSSHLLELLSLTPRYLACPTIADFIVKNRLGLFSPDKKIKVQANITIKKISQTLINKNLKQPKKYGYWGVDYFYNEVLCCLKTLKKIKKSDKTGYIESIEKAWGIPKEYVRLLESEIKNPSQLTLDIMTSKGMISDSSSYRNVIQPHLKKLKAKYPYIRTCDYLVEHLLDLPTKAPNFFSRLDLLKQLDEFTFELTDEELKTSHAISHPTHAIGV